MKVLVVTSAPLIKLQDKTYAYAPYVDEMKVWDKYARLSFASVIWKEQRGLLVSEIPFNIEKVYPLADFNLKSKRYFFKAVYHSFLNVVVLMKAMKQADHIHLRCPGNIGLLGCFVQMLFPNKPKTAKYAGNWDPKATQPWSYRLQKWLLSNTFLTKNMKVLVYGEWPNQSKNIVPFFTASYSEKDYEEIQRHPELVSGSHEKYQNHQLASSLPPSTDGKEQYLPTLLTCPEQSRRVAPNKNEPLHRQMLNQVQYDDLINFLFVGALTKGKQPLLSVAVVQKLKEKGHQVRLDIYGEGPERGTLEHYIQENDLKNEVVLHGNCDREVIKLAYQSAHFLLFISQSEGWPKAVAEAMFCGCLPITSKVSCIPYMIANGERGALVNPNADEIVAIVEDYLQHPDKYNQQATKAMQWSRQFTMEKFEDGIRKLLE